MAINKTLATLLMVDVLLVALGSVELGFVVVVDNEKDRPATDGRQLTRHLLYQRFPLTAGMFNAALVIATFAVSALALSMHARVLLKATGVMAVVCSVFTTVVGLYVWALTLRTRASMAGQWTELSPAVQDMLQTEFECCGYFNSTSPVAFIRSAVCPGPAAAALMRGCAAPLTSYINNYVDDVFTVVFGMVGVEIMFFLAVVCVLKDWKQRERFRFLDAKSRL